MGQLQFFSPRELAGMRDRSASRSYSPEGEEFRREHERHRAWGLIQRRGQRLRHLRNQSRAAGTASALTHREQVPAPAPAPALVSAPVPAVVSPPVPALVSAPVPALVSPPVPA